MSTATYNTSNQMISATQNGGSALVYDAAGNVTNDGLNSYLYDAEGRICAVNTRGNLQSSDPAFLGYIYDAAGIRVARGYMSTFSCNFSNNGFVVTTSWALGQGGEQVGEWKLVSGTWAWQHSNTYADGKLLGTYDQSGLHFYFNDWLGTRRIQTNALGQVELTCTSLPFGNGENCTASGLSTAVDPTEHHFTGKERDTESGNDYFEARYYSSSLGRFLSPDWSEKEEPIPYAKLDDPQSLNLYAYVRNSPTAGIDPDGHETKCGFDCKANRAWNSLHEITNDAEHALKGEVKPAIRAAKKGLDKFNTVLGFGKTNCAGGGSCSEAGLQAAGAIIAGMASDGASEDLIAEGQIATASNKIENLVKKLPEETLDALNREINEGMSVAKSGGSLFDHINKAEEVVNGLNRQATHLERMLKRPGLSEGQANRISGLVERARGAVDKVNAAISRAPE